VRCRYVDVLTTAADAICIHVLLQTLQQQQQQQQPEADDNIKVVVRVRPLFPAELAKGATNVIQVAEDCSSLQVGTNHEGRCSG
jgi:hypothetical protein